MAEIRNSEIQDGRIRFMVQDHPRHQNTVQHGQPANALNIQSQAQIEAVHAQFSNQMHTNLVADRVGNLRSESSESTQIIRSPFPRQVFSPAMSGYEASSEVDTDIESHAVVDEHTARVHHHENDDVLRNHYTTTCERPGLFPLAQNKPGVYRSSRPCSDCVVNSLLSFVGGCICQPADAGCSCCEGHEDSFDDMIVDEARPLLKGDMAPNGQFQSASVIQNQPGYQSMRKPDSKQLTARLKNT